MEGIRHLRAAVFLAIGGYIVLGPAYPQVFLGTPRNAEQPWLPMAWQMYHSVGAGLCQASFWSQEDGVQHELPHERLERTIKRKRGDGGRYSLGQRVRDNDVIFSTEADLPPIVTALCAGDAHADVHAYARCSPSRSGAWKVIADGEKNLCQKE